MENKTEYTINCGDIFVYKKGIKGVFPGEKEVVLGLDEPDHCTAAVFSEKDNKLYISFSGGGSLVDLLTRCNPTSERLTIDQIIQGKINFIERGQGYPVYEKWRQFIEENSREMFEHPPITVQI